MDHSNGDMSVTDGEAAARNAVPQRPAGVQQAAPEHDALRQLQARINNLDVLRHFDIRTTLCADGAVEARLTRIAPYHLGGMETRAVNGLILMGLIDCALVVPAIVRLGGQRCATIETSVKILRPVIPRDVRAVGRVLSHSREIVFTQAEIFDCRGKVRATATGVVTRV